MAKHFSGIDGELYIDGAKAGTVQTWSLSAQVAVLPTTTLGDFAETAVFGNQSFTGSCTVYYYEKSDRTVDGRNLFTRALRTTDTGIESTNELRLRYINGAVGHELKFRCLLNQVDIAATAGEIVTAQISFTVTGPLTTATIA